MPAPTIADTLKFANLQMATEALYEFNATLPGANLEPGKRFVDPLTAAILTTGNLHASKFTATEATKFAAEWTVVEHISNTATGFSGTLLKKESTNEFVLSFRSTEFLDDHARDNTATNVLEIKEKGFAFGQLSDMEDWYKSLQQGGTITGPLSVTGYSLGAHMATAFNLLHPGVAQQVVTFNGAGIGTIGDPALAATPARLPAMIARFSALRSQGETTGFLDSFQSVEGRQAYLDIQAHLASTLGVPRAAVGGGFNDALTALANAVRPNTPDDTYAAQREADYKLLNEAVSRIKQVYQAAHYAPTLGSGSTEGPPNPANVQDLYTRADGSQALAIASESIDYQLAVLLTQTEYDTRALGPIDSIAAALGNPTRGAGWPLSNQWDILATETTTDPWYGVAYSQYRYGNDVKLFIEDQPFTRGDFLGATFGELIQGSIQLLHPNYALNDFGDTHSLVLIVDSLNVQNTILNLLPPDQRAGTMETLNTILKNASWRKAQPDSGQGKAEGDVLENVVNALADLILGPQIKANRLNGSPDGNTWATAKTEDFLTAGKTYTGRDSFYEKLQAITNSTAYKALADKLTLTPITANLSVAGRTDFGAFAALYSLSPFQLAATGDILKNAVATAWGETYTTWQQDKDTLADASKPQVFGITDQWLADRTEFLTRKNTYATQNVDPYNPDAKDGNGLDASVKLADVYFEDAETDYKIQQGRLEGSAARRYFFGKRDADDTFQGGDYDDHLYGNGGNDTLTGNGGNDYLEGNAGSDLLDGGESDDTLVGGKDADLLVGGTDNDTVNGGQGLDTYVWNSNDGDDTLIDSDRRGRILINGSSLKLLVKDGATWKSPDGKLTLTQGDTWKLSIDGGGSIDLGTGFSDGDYGIYRTEIATGGTELNGDLTPKDDDPVTDGLQLGYDSQGNLKVTTTEDPGRNDKLYGSGDADTIRALAGDDVVEAGGGNDLVAGGSGSDIVRGQDGHDTVWGDDALTTATPLATALARGDTDTGQTERGDWVDGGAGNDILVGAAAQDLLTGGNDHDLLIGGAGDDLLLGDVTVEQALTDWSVNRSMTNNEARYRSLINRGTLTSSDTVGGADALYGGAGDDWALGGAGDDLIDGGSGSDILLGENGNDMVFGEAGNASIADALAGGDTDISQITRGDWVDGGAGDDLLVGSAAQDILTGGTDNDLLIGGAGDDLLLGDDALYSVNPGWSISREVLPGDNSTTYRYYVSQGITFANTGNALPPGQDVLYGGRGDDWLFAGGSDDLLDGGADNDVLFGEAGNDVVRGGSGNDNLNGDGAHIPEAQQGADWLDGGEGQDTLYGGGGDDILNGGEGIDFLSGNDGNDVIIGGAGDDTLYGGAGRDTYLFNRGDGHDTVYDTKADNDIFRFGEGISQNDITLHLGSLLLDLGNGDEIHIGGFDRNDVFNSASIGSFEFADGSTLSSDQLLARGFDLDGTADGGVGSSKSRRWRHGERGSRAANDVQWRRQA